MIDYVHFKHSFNLVFVFRNAWNYNAYLDHSRYCVSVLYAVRNICIDDNISVTTSLYTVPMQYRSGTGNMASGVDDRLPVDNLQVLAI